MLAAVVATPAATMLLRHFVRSHLLAPRAMSAA
jgi:GMP synthase (glutamine-hydrolysing)